MSGSVTGRMGYRADCATVMPGMIAVNATRESNYFVYGRLLGSYHRTARRSPDKSDYRTSGFWSISLSN
jgi:hypothetical protein